MKLPTQIILAAAATALAACSTPEPVVPDLGPVMVEASIPHASTPAAGLACGGQIDADQMDALAAAGVTRFISLRADDETGSGWEEAHAATAGHDFVRLTISGKEAINDVNAAKLRAEIDGAKGPVLVYCGSSNRVGTLLGLGAFNAGEMNEEEALDFARRAGMTRLEPILAERLKAGE